jgi:hypothetical protein
MTATVTEPGYPDAVTDPYIGNAGSYRVDISDNLMARNDRIVCGRDLAVEHMKIRPANSASGDPDQKFAAARYRNWTFNAFKRPARAIALHGNHARHGKRSPRCFW